MSNPPSSKHIHPYLMFNGRCEEAIEFYRKALGAEVQMIMRYKDNPEPEQCKAMPPEMLEKVMHASLTIGQATVMMSDGHCNPAEKFEGFALAINFATPAEVESAFATLVDGGKPVMPPARTFWSPSFGMVTDRFGLMWMVSVEPACNS